MKSDHAIPTAGLPRPSLPPLPSKKVTRPAFSDAPRLAVSSPTVVPRTRWSLPPTHAHNLARARRATRLVPLPRDLSFLLLALVATALVLMGYAYVSGRRLVIVRINDFETQLWTRQQTVRSALLEAGINWNAEDVIRPALDAPLAENGLIQIRPAAPVVISADGNVLERRTQSANVSAVLGENGISLKPQDQVFMDGRLVRSDATLPRFSASAGNPAILAPQTGPVHLSVTRALPIIVNDNGINSTIYTTENTLGTALAHAGIPVYLGDYFSPDLTTPVTTGASIYIRRSRPASITVDGRTIKTRTREDTVSGLLAQEGIVLEGKDYAVPPPTTALVDGLSVNVTRVREEFLTESEEIPFQTRFEPNAELELDQRAIGQVGSKGIKNRLFKSVYENGKLISRSLEREWIAQEKKDHILYYGTKVVVRDLQLPDGSTVQYWRKIRLLATAYTAATSGKAPDHPEYGITRLGLNAGRGIVAVDPRVIGLREDVYVPGYGIAYAGDTGGRIKGRRIDLGFAEGALEDWFRWVDVYVLTPVPPKSQITIVLPDYPAERTQR